MSEQHYYIGLMSGTSLDGLDAVLCDFPNNTIPGNANCRDTQPRQLAAVGVPFAQDYVDAVNQLIAQPCWSLFGQVHSQYAEYAQQGIAALLDQAGLPATVIRAIGSHGQTIWHQPSGEHAFTLQLGDPNRIAAVTGIPVVADCRGKDIACGGQGAPLVPAFHAEVLADAAETRIIANIGGIANITVLQPGEPVVGFDTGPGNGLMNAWAQHYFQQPYDAGGQLAAAGQLQAEWLAAMLADPYFSQSAPKSTGREHFHWDWLMSTQPQSQSQSIADPRDGLATLAALTARSLSQACITYQPDRVMLCGGGVHNQHLQRLLADQLNCPVESTSDYGVDADWLEAMAFAWLAERRMTQQSGNLPSVTGASVDTILGAVYWP